LFAMDNTLLYQYLSYYSYPYLTLSILPIGIEKPKVRAKGINHPKVRSRGDLLPCSSASLLYLRQP
jgi:hypothetical protein